LRASRAQGRVQPRYLIGVELRISPESLQRPSVGSRGAQANDVAMPGRRRGHNDAHAKRWEEIGVNHAGGRCRACGAKKWT